MSCMEQRYNGAGLKVLALHKAPELMDGGTVGALSILEAVTTGALLGQMLLVVPYHGSTIQMCGIPVLGGDCKDPRETVGI